MLNAFLCYQIAMTSDLVHRRNSARDTATATQPDSQSHYLLSLWYQLTATRTSQQSPYWQIANPITEKKLV